MLAVYVSALIVFVGSIAVGRALMRLLGREETTWIEGAVGLALLAVVGSFLVRVFDTADASAIALGVLILGSLAYLRGQLLPLEDLKLAAGPALVAALVASVPMIANERLGILGVGINNDLASHLLWADWLRDQVDPVPVSLATGYPVGPHSIFASLGQAFGFESIEAIVGLLVAVAALTAVTSLAVLRRLPPARRLLGAVLVGLPYMTASALSVGGFKETTLGLILLGFVLALARLERDYPGDRALLVSLGVLAAGAMAVYTYPGIYWLLAAAGLLGLVGVVRAMRRAGLGEAIRSGWPVVIVPGVVFLVLAATEIDRANTFRHKSGIISVIEGDSKLRDAVSPLEGLGVWPDSNFLAGVNGPPLWPLFGLIGVVALVLAARWWLRRGELAVPLGVLGAGLIYLGTVLEGGLYVQAKALAVPAPLVMLLIVRALLDRGEAAEPAAAPGELAPRAAPGWALPALGGVFVAVAAISSLLALRDAVVAPNEHAEELDSIRERVRGDWTLSLTTDRFTDAQLQTTLVGSPSRNSQIIVPSRNGKDFRLPLDFDSVAPETLDTFNWVLVTSAPYRSEPPENLELVAETDSYQLWKRVGPTSLTERVFGEEARPGKVLGCRAKDLAIAGKRANAKLATIFAPPPVIGKRFSWEPGGTLDPGDSATQKLTLPPGKWQLSMQYQSPVVGLTVESAGESFELPPAMDGAIPFRLGQGPFWPVGEITSSGGPVEIEARADDVSTFQKLIGVGRAAAVGNIVATRTDPYRTIDFAQACNAYVDHYTIDPAVLDPAVVKHRREIAEFAQSGHYQPKDISEPKAEGRTN